MHKKYHAIKALFFSPLIILTSTFAFSQEQTLTSGKSTLPEISASYKIDVISNDQSNTTKHSENILIWRQHNLFEIQHLETSFGEYWELQDKGRVLYSWIHHNRDFIVLHEPTFINSPDAGVSFWESKATFFDDELLETLSKTGDSIFQGYPSDLYEGTINGKSIAITWIPTLALPMRIEQEQEDDIYSITLQEVQPYNEFTWTSIDTNNYKEIEYVDFEDEQTDPDVQFYMGILNEEVHNH